VAKFRGDRLSDLGDVALKRRRRTRRKRRTEV